MYRVIEKRILIEFPNKGFVIFGARTAEGLIWGGDYNYTKAFEVLAQILKMGWDNYKKVCLSFNLPEHMIACWEEIYHVYKDDYEEFYKEHCNEDA